MPNIRLESGLPVFEPAMRHAILINSWDSPTGFSREKIHLTGNERIYDLLFTLTGAATHLVSSDVDRSIAYRTERRGHIAYDPTHVIFPDGNIESRLRETVEDIEPRSSDGSLTFLYWTTHGQARAAETSEGLVPYERLFSQYLDCINGRKVAVLLGCHSGSAIDVLHRHRKKEDYVLLTSTGAHELSTNWGDSEFHRLIDDSFYRDNRLSALALPDKLSHGGQSPQIVGNFDAIM